MRKRAKSAKRAKKAIQETTMMMKKTNNDCLNLLSFYIIIRSIIVIRTNHGKLRP